MHFKGFLSIVASWLLIISSYTALPTTTLDSVARSNLHRRGLGTIRGAFNVARASQPTMARTYADKAVSFRNSGRKMESGIASVKAFVHSTSGFSHVAAVHSTAKKLTRLKRSVSSDTYPYSMPILIRRSAPQSLSTSNRILMQKRGMMGTGAIGKSKSFISQARQGIATGLKKVDRQISGIRAYALQGADHQRAGTSFIRKYGKKLKK